jgi:hypothetical protein
MGAVAWGLWPALTPKICRSRPEAGTTNLDDGLARAYSVCRAASVVHKIVSVEEPPLCDLHCDHKPENAAIEVIHVRTRSECKGSYGT